MEKTVSATEARVHFGEILRKVAEDEQVFIVERGGQPAAAVLPLATYRRLKARIRSGSWQETLEQARALRERIAERRGGQPLPPPEDMIEEARRLRDDQLTDLR